MLFFRSSDTDIDLVSIDEFHAQASSEINNMEVTKNDPHQLHLARLTYELKERKKLLILIIILFEYIKISIFISIMYKYIL